MKQFFASIIQSFATPAGSAKEVYSPRPNRADESPRPVVLAVVDTPNGLVTVTMGGQSK